MGRKRVNRVIRINQGRGHLMDRRRVFVSTPLIYVDMLVDYCSQTYYPAAVTCCLLVCLSLQVSVSPTTFKEPKCTSAHEEH
jgi:hypothetical protein